MNQFEEFKKFLDKMNIKYEIRDANYFIGSLGGKTPCGHDVNCKDGYIQIDLREYVLGFGFCSLTFARDDGRFIGVEAE